jgi:hypothetical protein
MGFWPYFLHAHRSDGITSPPPPARLLVAGGAGIQTTFLTSFFLEYGICSQGIPQSLNVVKGRTYS